MKHQREDRLVTKLMRALIALFALAFAGHAAVFSFYSGFQTNTEGWTIGTYGQSYPGGIGPVHFSSGGVSNSGFIRAEDSADGYLMFLAPSSWSGDLSGGTLSFYLRSFNPDNYSLSSQPEPLVWITDGTNNLFLLRGGSAPGISGTNWTFNSLALTPSNPNWSTLPWAAAPPSSTLVASVLSNVTQIGILADWVSRYATHPLGCNNQSGNCADITGLDEVRLYSSDVVIPEPSTAVITALGLFVGGLALRRRK